MEIWKPIIGFENLYSISNLGRVKRIKGGKGTRKGFIKKNTLDKTAGYEYTMLCKNGKLYPKRIHVLLAESFLIKPIAKTYLEVDHINRNKSDNRLINLRWVTRSENTRNSSRWRN